MTAARNLTDADVDTLRALLREHEDAVVERVEARLRRRRPVGQRRVRAPEVVAAIAEEASGPVDEVAAKRARSALDKIRSRAR